MERSPGGQKPRYTQAESVEFYKTLPLEGLIKIADEVCRSVHSNKVYLRGLIEFSNYCVMNCLYCGIRYDNISVHRYRLTVDEIIGTIDSGLGRGLSTFVLQSGEDPEYTINELCLLAEKAREKLGDGKAITMSCGIMSKDDYARLKRAGVDRYLLRFETSDSKAHQYFRNGLTLERRIKALEDLKELGFETGSGFMVGMPGETEATRINNALLCKQLELDMVGIGPFIPHPETPLGGAIQVNLNETLRLTALLRLLLPKANIPATTAAGSLEPDGREKMLAAGANVLMPNITPVEHKKDYLLYPGKICLDESGLECLSCMAIRVMSVGKVLDYGLGKSIKSTSPCECE